MISSIKELSGQIKSKLSEKTSEQAMLVGISGIDASGKGYVTAELDSELRSRSIKTALINVDGWLDLPSVRFGGEDPGRHFYEHALRFEAMFDQLILPLKYDRRISITADHLTETSDRFEPYKYEFIDIDVILLEGIFLFKRRFVSLFDLRIWVECSFETALSRAVERSQEGLSPERTILAYNTIYFPAQRHHFAIDDPVSAASLIIDNG